MIAHYDKANKANIERYIKVFISCSHEDLSEAKTYKEKLQTAGFAVSLYEDNLYGEALTSIIKAQITACDFFLLLISSYSIRADRPWVARELGLALKISESNFNYRPIIIPIFCRGAHENGADIVEFPVRDFETGDLVHRRIHSLHLEASS